MSRRFESLEQRVVFSVNPALAGGTEVLSVTDSGDGSIYVAPDSDTAIVASVDAQDLNTLGTNISPELHSNPDADKFTNGDMEDGQFAPNSLVENPRDQTEFGPSSVVENPQDQTTLTASEDEAATSFTNGDMDFDGLQPSSSNIVDAADAGVLFTAKSDPIESETTDAAFAQLGRDDDGFTSGDMVDYFTPRQPNGFTEADTMDGI